MIKTLSDKIVAYTLSTIFTLTIGICTLIAVFTVDNSTRAGTGNPSENPPIISAGSWHSLAIIDGELYACGKNLSGELGIGSTVNKNIPMKVGNQANWVNALGAYESSFAINSLGELWSWGRNSGGQLGHGDTTYRYEPTRVGTASNWVSISGMYHILAINTAGELWSWGSNNGGQLGLGNKNSGNYSPTRVGTATNWTNISAGEMHTLAINTAGELWSWGENRSGQLGLGNYNERHVPTRVGTASNWVSISAGGDNSLAINELGELWAWGSINGQLIPVQVGIETNWETITAGGNHALAINSLGELYAWGYNYYGQLGLGDTASRTIPTRVGTETNWVSIATGDNHSLAINQLGEIWSCGHNRYGELGLGYISASDVNYVGATVLAIIGSNVSAPNSVTNMYTVSIPSATRVKINGSYTFTITMQPTYTAPIVKLNTQNGKLNFSSIDENTYTYTISNVTGDITANNFTISVSRIT